MPTEPVSPEIAAHSNKLVAASALRRLHVLVERARRQEEIEDSLWHALLRLAIWFPLAFGLMAALMYGVSVAVSEYPALVSRVSPKKFFVVQTGFNRADSPARDQYREGAIARLEAAGNGVIANELRSLGRSGAVAVTLVIRNDGTLERAIIMKSSGDKELDRFACRIVRNAAPFQPIPADARRSGRMVISRWLAFDYANRGPEGIFPAGYMKDRLAWMAGIYGHYADCPAV